MSKCSVLSTSNFNRSHCTGFRPKYWAFAAGARLIASRTPSTPRPSRIFMLSSSPQAWDPPDGFATAAPTERAAKSLPSLRVLAYSAAAVNLGRSLSSSTQDRLPSRKSANVFGLVGQFEEAADKKVGAAVVPTKRKPGPYLAQS